MFLSVCILTRTSYFCLGLVKNLFLRFLTLFSVFRVLNFLVEVTRLTFPFVVIMCYVENSALINLAISAYCGLGVTTQIATVYTPVSYTHLDVYKRQLVIICF